MEHKVSLILPQIVLTLFNRCSQKAIQVFLLIYNLCCGCYPLEEQCPCFLSFLIAVLHAFIPKVKQCIGTNAKLCGEINRQLIVHFYEGKCLIRPKQSSFSPFYLSFCVPFVDFTISLIEIDVYDFNITSL